MMKRVIIIAIFVLFLSIEAVARPSYEVVFISPEQFGAALTPLIDDARADGWKVDLFTTEYIESVYPGSSKKEKIKAALQDFYNCGMEAVCFVGDADYSGTEPEKDMIPLWYYYCPEIGYWRDDRATVIDYVDFDGDRLPDVTWTCVPSDSVWQVENFVSKSLFYKNEVDPSSQWLNKCLWLVEDEDLEGNSGAITRMYADSLMNCQSLRRFTKTAIYDSDIPYGYYNREDTAVAAINEGAGLIFGMGTVSNRTCFVDFMSGYFGFRVNEKLTDNGKCGVYFGLCCGLGDYDRPVDPDCGPDLCSQFLFSSGNRGATFWIAPSSNTRYQSNYLLGKALVDQLFQLGARTTAEAGLLALRKVMLEHPEFSEVWESQNFFGSPFHVLHGMKVIVPTSVDRMPKYPFELSQNYPNPFNPITTIRYSVPKSGHVSVRVYDVNGRLVKVLYEGYRKAGSYSITWNGRNGKGRELASGVYFCQLRQGDKVQNKKLVLLR